MSDSERECFAWGFCFHDACWNVLKQASAPDNADVKALWRILLSVSCHKTGLVNWGHNHGGLYYSFRVHRHGAPSFSLIRRHQSITIPSAYFDPFKVPELQDLIAKYRIKSHTTTPRKNPERLSVIIGGAWSCYDIFSVLPTELKAFFQSRFWPGREFDIIFDGFLLSPAQKRGIDWKGLFRAMQSRLRRDEQYLGERNRSRLWQQTVKNIISLVCGSKYGDTGIPSGSGEMWCAQ
ncbi:hypothetical protein AAE478_009496 [Parahypoxylon ruwenzoriense]